jgi:hypothetical protein
MNVFKEVKRIQNREIRATNELKDIWNEELALKRQYRDLIADAVVEKRAVEIRLSDVMDRKRRKIDSVIRIQTEYLDIDKEFEQEMLVHRRSITRRYDPCNWLKM